MFLTQLFNGLALGMVYALVAIGYSLVFGILEMINFAHGATYAFGAILSWFLVTVQGWNVVPACGLSIVVTGLLGILLERFGLRPLRRKGSNTVTALITTIGLSYIIENCLTIAFGGQAQRFALNLDFAQLTIFGVEIGSSKLIITGISLLLLLVLYLILQKTKIGLAMRTVGESTSAAAICGINVNLVIMVAFFLSGACAAIAGTLVGGYYQRVSPSMGATVGNKACAAAVVGGLGSLPGAVVGGLVVGLSEGLAAAYLGGTYTDTIAYVVLFIVLLFKPSGIFSAKGISKV